MSFKCDFPLCTQDGVYLLEYCLEKDEQGDRKEDARPDFHQHRCEEHILAKQGLNHSSCGLPERIIELNAEGNIRNDLVRQIEELFRYT